MLAFFFTSRLSFIKRHQFVRSTMENIQTYVRHKGEGGAGEE